MTIHFLTASRGQDKADALLENYLRNITTRDLMELMAQFSTDPQLCQRIQVNILTDITEVGRILRAALIEKFQRTAANDARAESEQ